jgi:hypothetical protein
VNYCGIVDNGCGVFAASLNDSVDARWNWWGSPEGPQTSSYFQKEIRDSVHGPVIYEPWLPDPPGLRGDANSDGRVNPRDLRFIFDYFFRFGPGSGPMGDANGDGRIDAADIVYLRNLLYPEGDRPIPHPSRKDDRRRSR